MGNKAKCEGNQQLGGIGPLQQEPGCFNHSSRTWLSTRTRGGMENAICRKQQPNDLEVHKKVSKEERDTELDQDISDNML